MTEEEILKVRYENKYKKLKSTLLTYSIIGVVASMSVGLFVGSLFGGKGSIGGNYGNSELSEFLEFYDYFKNNYYQDVDERTLIDGLYYGLTNSVDDEFTFYTSTANNESQNLSTSGVGFGFMRSVYYGNMLLRQVMTDSPASKAEVYRVSDSSKIPGGLKEGDIITKMCEVADGDEFYVFKEHSASEWTSKVTGEKDTQVIFEFIRNGETYRANVTRGSYNQDKLRVIKSDFTSDYKYTLVNISTFLGNAGAGETTPQGELNSYLKTKVFKETDRLNNLIIDLRDNGGGYVSNFCDLVGLFTENSTITGYYQFVDGTYSALKTSDDNTNYANKIDHYTLIVNENTASAAESFVIAMQDIFKDKVDVFGETSYGKGIAQNFYYVNGDGSTIRYTFAKVCSPSKRCINKRGIVPTEENTATYSSIQDKDIYYFWRHILEGVTSNDEISSKDKAVIKQRIELLTNKTYDSLELAIEGFQNSYKLEKDSVFSDKTADKLNDLFFDYYHEYMPLNIYDAAVYGDNENYDNYSTKQMNCVKAQINLLTGTTSNSFYQAVSLFQDNNGLTGKNGLFDIETSYLLQGKMYELRVEKEDSVLTEVLNKKYGA